MSIIIHYNSEEEAFNSKTGQSLDKKTSDLLKKLVEDKKKMMQKSESLTRILKVDSLSPQEVCILINPWYRANMLASWWENEKWSDKKCIVKDYIKLFNKLEEMLSKDQNDLYQLMLLMTSSEPDISKFLIDLKELREFFNIFVNLEFRNGKTCSADYFIRYAINSLFFMAEKMELQKTGKPPQLSQYIDLITERFYTDRNKDRFLFTGIDFLKEYEKNKNIPIWYIFNPYCKKVEMLLNKIRSHQNSLIA